MQISILSTSEAADEAAANCLAAWLTDAQTRNVMVAGGNTPMEVYRKIAERRLALGHLNLFALDEYVGVPEDDPRTCANLLRRRVALAWGIPPSRFFALSSLESDALDSVGILERRLEAEGGLDVVVLGLGQNGHVGFNEPGSAEDARGRVLDLESGSVAANRQWFGGQYAPARGVTTGLKTILASRHILMLAHGPLKAAAVRAAVRGPRSPLCPASFLQAHPDTRLFLDKAAAAELASTI